jgi:SET domain-containing protein
MPRRKPMIEVRHSKVHGYGVFALRQIRKGTQIIEYLGDRVSHREAERRYEDKAADDNHTFLFTIDAKTVIDAGVGGNDARYINHGCDPNCESASIGRRIFIEAIRTIRPGEELAYDYQIERDADDEPDVDRIFACRCGAAACRGSMLVPPKKSAAARRGGQLRGKQRARGGRKKPGSPGSRRKPEPLGRGKKPGARGR